jgi:hypothetical protein
VATASARSACSSASSSETSGQLGALSEVGRRIPGEQRARQRPVLQREHLAQQRAPGGIQRGAVFADGLTVHADGSVLEHDLERVSAVELEVEGRFVARGGDLLGHDLALLRAGVGEAQREPRKQRGQPEDPSQGPGAPAEDLNEHGTLRLGRCGTGPTWP